MGKHVRAPGPYSVHVNEALTQFALTYFFGKYFADFMSPRIRTEHYSNTFWKFLRKDVSTPVEDLLGPESMPQRDGYKTTNDTYQCDDRGLGDWIPWREIKDSDDVLAPRRRRVEHLLGKMALNREVRIADIFNTSGNYAAANVISPSNAWSDQVSGDPINDFLLALEVLPEMGGGDFVTRAIMEESLWHKCIQHPKVGGLLGSGDRGLTSRQQLAQHLGIDEIVVSRAKKNTANYAATPSYSSIWDTDKVSIVRVPRGEPTADSQMFMGTFTVNMGQDQGEGAPQTIVTEDFDPKRGGGEGSMYVKVARGEDDKILQNDMGVLITGV